MTENADRRLGWLGTMLGDATPQDQRNMRRFGAWAIAYGLTFTVATMVLNSGQLPAGVLPWLVAIVPTLVGLGVVVSYVRFLQHADELLRRIHLEALAWGFGTGVLFMMGYRLLERAGAPGLDINDPLLVMGLVWTFCLIILPRRYLA